MNTFFYILKLVYIGVNNVRSKLVLVCRKGYLFCICIWNVYR